METIGLVLGIVYIFTSLIPFLAYFRPKRFFLKGFLFLFQISGCLRGFVTVLRFFMPIDKQIENFLVILSLSFYVLCIFFIVVSQIYKDLCINILDCAFILGYILFFGISSSIVFIRILITDKYLIYAYQWLVLAYSLKVLAVVDDNRLKFCFISVVSLGYISLFIVYILSDSYRDIFLIVCIGQIHMLSTFHINIVSSEPEIIIAASEA